MSASVMFWEHFSVGQEWTHHRGEALGEDEIIAFAKQYDPLYIHTDPVRALSGPLGIHCASGVHTFAIAQRMLCDALFSMTHIVAGHRIDSFIMHRPVRPRDMLSLTVEVMNAMPHARRDDCGWVTFAITVLAAGTGRVLTYDLIVLIGRARWKRQPNR
ncbi:MaoC/PaaZ C-terminal domain-containing protein [Pseudomonas sp. SAS7]|uniref:MaoC/PaaZ C-terminal domain-containing protein n=1 Tax=Pseudomonas sp. SAS7 TaxID=3156487 RepID=UPI003F98E468